MLQALQLAFALLLFVSSFGYDLWVIAIAAYMGVVLLKDNSHALRTMLVWAVLIGAIMTAFNVVVIDLYVTAVAYRMGALDEGFWRATSVDLLYLLVIAALTSLPVINESRRRKNPIPA